MRKEVIIYLAGRFIPASVSLALIILAIRFLGPIEYGRYSLMLYSAMIAVTLTFHWVQVSILRFLGGAPRETNVVMSRFFDLTIFAALVSTVIVVIAGLFYFHLSTIDLVLLALFAFLNHFYLFHTAILQAYHRSIRTAILEGADQVLILLVFLAGIFIFDLTKARLMFLALVSGLAGVLVLRLFIRVRGLLTVDMKHVYWDSRFCGKVIEFGYGITLWLFFSHIIMAADRFILKEHFGYHDAGSYSAIKDLIYKAVIFTGLPIYISYQTKIADLWNSQKKWEAWTNIKEAFSFQMLIYIIVFIVFMVIKSMLFREILKIPEVDSWIIYLPLILAAFAWQAAVLLQRFVELVYRASYLLIAIAVCTLLNILLNLLLVPRYGMEASPAIMFLTSLLYLSFLFLMAFLGSKKIAEHQAVHGKNKREPGFPDPRLI